MALDSILSTPVMPPPPKSSVSSSSPSSSASGSNASSGAGNTSDSASATHQSSSSGSHGGGANSSDSNHSTRSSGRAGSSNSSGSSGRQTQSSSKSSQSSPSKQTTASGQAQSANATANGKNAAAQSAKNPGPSFLQTLAAQSQTDAQDSATAATTASPPTTITGKGKGKTAKDDTAADSAASLGFLSQSLVAAMAGIQQQPQAQAAAANNDDSVDGVSLSSGSSAQSLVANLIQSTAEELKAPTVDSAKADAGPANTTPAMDAGTAAAASFQSHLGVSSQSQTQASQQVANTQVNTPVGANGFADEVGDKITWMAHQGVQSASLQMTPEHMGPVEVKISVQAGSATVAINAAHADTRAALEQALPRLREMFSTQGMNLTDASVSQQFSREQPQKRAIGAIGPVGGVSDESASAVVSVASARLGLVDTYA